MINKTHLKDCSSKILATLTVSESKRLIAKGLLVYPPFKKRLNSGCIIITKGSTNTYIAEELLNKKIRSGAFVAGHITPENEDIKVDRKETLEELVLCNGKSIERNYTEVLADMKADDIILKGANIINYEKKQAGVLIAHPSGGTCGNIIDSIIKNNLHLIIPVGLEKCTGQDIDELSEITKVDIESLGPKVPYIWSIRGELFTEIEAIKQLANVEVVHLSSGGIGGAEGAVTLAIFGKEEDVYKAKNIIQDIQGEKPYIN